MEMWYFYENCIILPYFTKLIVISVDEPRVVKPKKTKPPQPSASEADPTDEEDGQKEPEPQDDSPRGTGGGKTVTLAPVKKSAGSSVAKTKKSCGGNSSHMAASAITCFWIWAPQMTYFCNIPLKFDPELNLTYFLDLDWNIVCVQLLTHGCICDQMLLDLGSTDSLVLQHTFEILPWTSFDLVFRLRL